MPNLNLTSGQVVPGFYGLVEYNSQGANASFNNRCLIWGYIKSTAQKTPNVPFRPASQQEADDGCGQGSDLAHKYAAAISQPEAQGADIWLMPIVAPSGGVASIYKFKTYVANTNPAKSGTIQMNIMSRDIPAVGFTASDTSATIATALVAAINTMIDLPVGTASVVSTDVASIPYAHKGTTGEDFPVIVNISPAGTGVALSPGQLLFATSATGAGSVKVNVGAISVSATISNADTAPTIATAIITAFNADTYPLTAVVDGSSSSQANLFFANDKVVRRISAAIITPTGTTVNLGSGATDGTGSAASVTYNGTLGTTAPSLTAALSNLAAATAYRSWSIPWTDATTVGAVATHIENNSNGSITGQKQQILTVADWTASSVIGAMPAATSPALTTSAPHYAALWILDCPSQAAEHAARIAAARAALWIDFPQKNWNGFQLKGNDKSPIRLPWYSPSIDAQNTALRTYALAPVVVGPSGNLEIVKGRTTSLATDRRLWAWSSEAQASYHAVDLAQFFQARFSGGSVVRYSDPKAAGIFDDASFISATQERMRFWEDQGNYDGADLLGPSVRAKRNAINPFREDIELPESPVLDLDQVCFVSHFSSPGS